MGKYLVICDTFRKNYIQTITYQNLKEQRVVNLAQSP